MSSDLERAARAFRHAEDAADERRQALAAEIVKAARAGMRQVDICRITGYTRERVRQILRADGVAADSR